VAQKKKVGSSRREAVPKQKNAIWGRGKNSCQGGEAARQGMGDSSAGSCLGVKQAKEGEQKGDNGQFLNDTTSRALKGNIFWSRPEDFVHRGAGRKSFECPTRSHTKIFLRLRGKKKTSISGKRCDTETANKGPEFSGNMTRQRKKERRRHHPLTTGGICVIGNNCLVPAQTRKNLTSLAVTGAAQGKKKKKERTSDAEGRITQRKDYVRKSGILKRGGNQPLLISDTEKHNESRKEREMKKIL